MAARLATDDGIAAYRHRGHIAERPPRPTSSTTWASASYPSAANPAPPPNGTSPPPSHNLFKAITGGYLTRQTLNALTS